MVTAWQCLERSAPGKQSDYLYELERADQRLQIRILRQRRKRMALYVSAGLTTELRVPLKCSWDAIHEFLDDKFEWAVAAERDLLKAPRQAPDTYHYGGSVRYLGQSLNLELHKSRWTIVEARNNALHVSCPGPSKPNLVEKHVLTWYRKQAEETFARRISALNLLFGDDVEPGDLVIRKMKARWGSCSDKGEICLNLLLIKQDLPQIDFVIAHELCHLRHFAHNKAFYALLDRVMPGWKEKEVLLGQAG
jgi:predicted metal-dependent hydrolase